MMNVRRFALYMAGCVLLLASCGTAKKTVAPLPAPEARLLPPLPPSQINIPVHINMKPLLGAMNNMTATEFTSEKWPDYDQTSCDFRYKYRFVRSPFTFSCLSNKVTIDFRGNYQIAGSRCVCAFDKQVSPWVSGSCGFGSEGLRRVDLSISSTLQLLPTHQVRTNTKLEKMQPLDKCQVTIMQNDLTQEVLDSIRASIESYCTSFDQFIQDINNNALLQQWRAGGNRVMPVSQYGFLNLNPSRLHVSPFNYYRDTLYFTMGFTGGPQFSSDSNRLVTHTPLPPVVNTPVNGGIHTYLDAVYEYSFFNKLLNDSLQNKPFEADGRTFVIKNVQVSGTNTGKIEVAVSFTGNRTGTLRLSGTPVLDTVNQVLSMPDVRVALDTKDIVVNIVKGLISKKIVKELKDQSVLDIPALIKANKAAIEKRLNQSLTDWLSTTGTINQVRLIGLLPQKNYIQVQAYIDADIMLIGSPPASLVNF